MSSIKVAKVAFCVLYASVYGKEWGKMFRIGEPVEEQQELPHRLDLEGRPYHDDGASHVGAGEAAAYAFLADIHSVLVEILAEIDGICRRNNIRYSISGGTVLGAVRHKGRFIPWDDDCDVEMPLRDYRRFLRIAKKQLDTERFFLQNKSSQRSFPFVFSKVRRHGTTDLVRDNWELPIHWGIAVDIFPTFRQAKWPWAERLSNFISGFASAFAYAPKAKSGPYKALYRLKLDGAATRFCLLLLQLMDSMLPTTGRYTMKYKFGLDESFTLVHVIPTVDIVFEGLPVRGPAAPEAYLDERRHKYGDWRVPAAPAGGSQYHADHIFDAHTDYHVHQEKLRRESAAAMK